MSAAVTLLSACLLAPLAGDGEPRTPGDANALAQGFRDVPAEARMRMYWRVFGPAWTEDEIDYQLEILAEAGVGGVMTYFLYPVAVDDTAHAIHNQSFLSAEFLKTFAYAASKARELGLRFGVNGGTGWPYGGPMVRASDSAKRLRLEYVDRSEIDGRYHLPSLKSGERYLHAFSGSSDRVGEIRDGVLAATGVEPLCVLVSGPTSMQVKRPAKGAEGMVLDHYDHEALARYLEVAVEPMLEAAPGLVESIGCDSLEVYGSNWTDHFATDAQLGYDLIPYLPRLFDDRDPLVKDLRFDFWRTLAEITQARFTRPLADWCRSHGVKLEMEAYGTPPNPMTSALLIDVPTGEHYEWKGFNVSRYVASSAHVAGKTIVGAEAWTWSGLPNRLADSLSDLKLVSDLHFLSGINDLTGVDFPYSPRSSGSPGWLPYYGPFMNQNNPQWPYFHGLVDYVNRCQWLLRQGKPVADVAVYLPVEDCFADGSVDQMLLDFHVRDHFVSGHTTSEFGLRNALAHHSNLIHRLVTRGFNLDGIDFWSMEKLARVEHGRLLAGDGSYTVVVVHDVTGISVDALQTIARFCREGGTVIATRCLPERSYGLRDRGARSRRVREIVADLFGETREDTYTVHPCGEGRAIFAPDDTESFERALATLEPDVHLEPYQPEVSFVHRRTEDRDIYFLANVGARPAAFTATLRTTYPHASLWQPMDGRIVAIPSRDGARDVGAGYRSVELELSPRGSIFVVFEQNPSGAPERRETMGASRRRVPLQVDWTVTFAGPDAPPPRTLRELASWTAWPDAKYYSGLATYAGTHVWEGPLPRRCQIAFDDVREAAEIKVNGRSAGVVWTPPRTLDITPLLKPGANVFEITVANLPVNRFLGLPDVDLKPLRDAFGNRFPAPDEKRTMSEPAPSGLLGQVVLIIEG